jgi:hypothetical protein
VEEGAHAGPQVLDAAADEIAVPVLDTAQDMGAGVVRYRRSAAAAQAAEVRD